MPLELHLGFTNQLPPCKQSKKQRPVIVAMGTAAISASWERKVEFHFAGTHVQYGELNLVLRLSNSKMDGPHEKQLPLNSCSPHRYCHSILRPIHVNITVSTESALSRVLMGVANAIMDDQPGKC